MGPTVQTLEQLNLGYVRAAQAFRTPAGSTRIWPALLHVPAIPMDRWSTAPASWSGSVGRVPARTWAPVDPRVRIVG